MSKPKYTGIIVYAFGTPANNSSNGALARYVESMTQKLYFTNNFLVYTQNDIQFHNFDTTCKTTYFPQHQNEDAPPTLRIARGAAQWARHHVSEVFVVAATPHRWRALRDTRKAFEEAVVNIPIQLMKFYNPDYMHDKGLFFHDYQPKEIIDDDTSYWFDPYGTQIRAASRHHWESRERILRLMPYYLYRMLAK